MNSNKIEKTVKEGLAIVLGSAVYAIAVELLLNPLKITPGGITGLSLLVNYLSGFPTGVVLIVLNIPLIILGMLWFGREFIIKSAVSVALSSIFIEILNLLKPTMISDRMLGAIFGGALLGVGLGLVMMAGGSTGGVDIGVKILNLKSNISIGRAFLLIDGIIIVFTAAIYGELELALYSGIAVFVSSKTVDLIIGGVNDSKAIFIITDKEEEVKKSITQTADRGITVLPAFGGYTGRKNNILLCVARNHEIALVRKLILEDDPSAFFFIVGAGDVVGKGFK